MKGKILSFSTDTIAQREETKIEGNRDMERETRKACNVTTNLILLGILLLKVINKMANSKIAVLIH